MAAVTVQNVVKSYAGQVVLDGVTLDLHRGEKVGLVGRNGCGKTTLFKLLMGLERPDSGTVTVSGGTTLGYLPQEPDLPDAATLIEAVGEAFAEHRRLESELEHLSRRIATVHGEPQEDSTSESALIEKYDRLRAEFEAAGGYGYEVRLREVLGGLGFGPQEYHTPVAVLSGGQKCRAALARLLLSGADLLLLDEPTNHLDIDATRWLEKHLAGHHGGAVIISHDRYLLDRVVGKIIEIEDCRAATYSTNYTGYAEAKRIRRLQAEREYARQAGWIAHQEDYIRRVHHAKDSAKQARGRRKMLDRMAADGRVLQKPKSQQGPMRLRFGETGGGGDMVIRCERAAKAYGDVVLIRDLDFEMTRGETVGIIGPNGVGKTTLLRMLLRQTDPSAGTVRLFENLTVGYYDQEHRDLDPAQSVLDAVRSVRPAVGDKEARSYLARFLFRGDDVFKRVGDLSGGEQSRVLLARLVWTGPQVLVLDEPTNHLDIPAREALEEALSGFDGSILVVSHDRYFLDRVVDRLLVLVERGRHEFVDGNWTTYAGLLAEREEAARREAERRRAERTRESQARSGGERTRSSRSKYAARRMEELESRIMESEARIKELEASFGDAAVMKDAEQARRLNAEYQELRGELAALNEQWERAVEGLAG